MTGFGETRQIAMDVRKVGTSVRWVGTSFNGLDEMLLDSDELSGLDDFSSALLSCLLYGLPKIPEVTTFMNPDDFYPDG